MPLLALGYGSFGDIVATAQLVVKIMILLRHRRLSSEWTETETGLKSLGNDLAQLTVMPVEETPFSVHVAGRIQDEISRCHLTMCRFYSKVSSSRGTFQTILFALSEEKLLASFRMRVIEHRMALASLVGLVNCGALMNGQDRVDQALTQITAHCEKILAVMTVVPRGVLQETFAVLSPVGVAISIPVVLCSSYQDLDRILKAYLHGHREAGSTYVERGDYNIVSPDGDIIRPPQFIHRRAVLNAEMRMA
ncbi:hypothetical protein B0H11DRAFT_235296 [Mycena galericulata]|nr:hypothetical protein B0H11DRAFT_235296 [Mycena galericulata]